LGGAYLTKWAGYLDSDNTWEPRSPFPDSVFEDDAGPLSFPFEVIETETASANAAALAAHKLSLTPKPFIADVSSESSDELVSSKDEWLPGTTDCLRDRDEESGGETEGYPGTSPEPTARNQITAWSSATTIPQTSAKKIVTLARVMMQRSDSVESYFRPAGHVASLLVSVYCWLLQISYTSSGCTIKYII
jgi:hypothetical protein